MMKREGEGKLFYGGLFLLLGLFGTIHSIRLLGRGERREKWLAYLFSSALLFAWGIVALTPLRFYVVRWLHDALIG
ncbi:hypothetical protein LptCag_2151 [Leptospirillum ferriphilum]|jgi:hypothetical protein|nr:MULTISPECIES: hypothetical protein [Leptospirillum]AFS54585.1 hypothetical protein LFML04_2395 [Leptospirillum ferriphilum ML-04]EAY58141.1 MAG: hypothetical protein UBAL2_82410558 [Leptospirillum rubarum]EDZ40086.1 MAG: Hypothetical protein CGL2_11111108 [Leptospirillum sp. Group II '5-way CG']EIJ76539.1 MAG: Hypothetical protein C75L2_00190011 [Leptospirillum sp. Group II 'C75']KGA94721.1 hypothetical protein LptCag_2151 [Leptospirillum ferriphilum]